MPLLQREIKTTEIEASVCVYNEIYSWVKTNKKFRIIKFYFLEQIKVEEI